MKGDSLVTVIIPTYNYAKYLPFAIDSVLQQTYRNIEVIVINDGSTDNTDEVIKPYLKNPKVRYIKKVNEGQTKTKNLGIREAKGDFIAFLDADDIWMPEKLEKQLPLFDDSDVGVVYSDFIQINDNNNEIKVFNNLKMYKGKITNRLFIDNFVCFPSAIVRKKCFDEMGLFDENLSMGIDWDLWLKFSTRYKFDFVEEPLVKYRVGHPGQMSKNIEKRFECAERIMLKFERQYGNTISNRVKKKAWAFTWRNRVKYYWSKDKKKALNYIKRALKENIFDINTYKLIVKLMINSKHPTSNIQQTTDNRKLITENRQLI